MSALVARFDGVRTVANGSITGSYVAVSTAFQHRVRILKFINTTDAGMYFSFDGTTDNDYVPANGFSVYDLTTNGTTNPDFTFQLFTQVYVKYETAPTTGSIYVIAVFGRGE
jgi:hypothetical protein